MTSRFFNLKILCPNLPYKINKTYHIVLVVKIFARKISSSSRYFFSCSKYDILTIYIMVIVCKILRLPNIAWRLISTHKKQVENKVCTLFPEFVSLYTIARILEICTLLPVFLFFGKFRKWNLYTIASILAICTLLPLKK